MARWYARGGEGAPHKFNDKHDRDKWCADAPERRKLSKAEFDRIARRCGAYRKHAAGDFEGVTLHYVG